MPLLRLRIPPKEPRPPTPAMEGRKPELPAPKRFSPGLNPGALAMDRGVLSEGVPLKPPRFGEPRKLPMLGAPRNPPVLGAPRNPPALGAPRNPILGAPRNPPILGAPRNPMLGAPR